MHIPDGFCSLPVCIGTAAVSAGVLGASVVQTVRSNKVSKVGSAIPAAAAGTVFAAQMLNFPVGAGTSGHFLGALAMASLFGPCRAYLIMLAVLAVQAFAFADGGITALGANLFNMGLIGGFGGYAILRGIMHFLPKGRKSYLTAVGVAAWTSVVLAAIACSIELALSGTIQFSFALPAMTGTHALIGIGEALITCAIVGAVSYSRPDILPDWSGVKESTSHKKPSTLWPVALVGLGISFFLAAVVSPFASASPDGLEKVAEDAGFIEMVKELWTMSPLPDYSVTSISDSALSTGIAGVLGVAIVFAICYAIYKILSAFRMAR